MGGLKFCNRQEECPLVMGAVEAKVKLQTELAVQRKEWEAKRAIMNSLYLAAVKLRKAQKKYFKTRVQSDLVASRVIESDLDELLEEIKLSASGHLTKQPIQPTCQTCRIQPHFNASRPVPAGRVFCIKVQSFALFGAACCIKPPARVQTLFNPFVFRPFPPFSALYQTPRYITAHSAASSMPPREMRVYTVLGKTNPVNAAWVCPTNAAHQFFKVKVEMP